MENKVFLICILLILVVFCCSCTESNVTNTSVPDLEPIDNGVENSPLYVISDGIQIAPRVEFAYSREWTEHGWLYADGFSWSRNLPQIHTELPVFTLSADFTVQYQHGVSFYYLSIYDSNFEHLKDCRNFSSLNSLSKGDYYIGIFVNEDGEYIDSQGESEYTGWVCAYKLKIEKANHASLLSDNSPGKSSALYSLSFF